MKRNKNGFECEVGIKRNGRTVITKTENLGISILDTTVIKEPVDRIYAAITGDRCAITDIRIKND